MRPFKCDVGRRSVSVAARYWVVGLLGVYVALACRCTWVLPLPLPELPELPGVGQSHLDLNTHSTFEHKYNENDNDKEKDDDEKEGDKDKRDSYSLGGYQGSGKTSGRHARNKDRTRKG